MGGCGCGLEGGSGTAELAQLEIKRPLMARLETKAGF